MRILGVPSAADRVAQTVAAMELEKKAEPIFHPDSYGYRPKRGALDAVTVCRRRCWEFDWVVEFDIRKFFDSVHKSPVNREIHAGICGSPELRRSGLPDSLTRAMAVRNSRMVP